MAQAQDMLRIRSDVRPIVSKGMGTQEQLGDQSSSYYASGKHFVGNDGFIYEATKDIQVGDTISVGTLTTDNCIKTDLCTVIDALDGNIPTKTSDLTNDSGFITNTVNNLVSYYLKTETYSKTEVDAIATAIKNSRFEVVATLPTTDIKTNVIYLVPTQSSTTSNVKDEYINLDGTTTGWEMIGSTSVDLSGYVTTQQLNTALASYVTSTSLSTILADYVQSSSLGTAAAKNFTDQVTSGSTDLVTSGAVSSSVQALSNDKVDKTVISSVIETLGNTPLKTGGYKEGEVFLASDGNLYKATTTISASTTISSGNCTQTSIDALLNDLAKDITKGITFAKFDCTASSTRKDMANYLTPFFAALPSKAKSKIVRNDGVTLSYMGYNIYTMLWVSTGNQSLNLDSLYLGGIYSTYSTIRAGAFSDASSYADGVGVSYSLII